MAIQYKNSRLTVENADLETLARKYGTPAYCYSAGQIRDNYRAYEKALASVMPRDAFTICYACKANSNLSVLRLLKNLGAGADIVSGGEFKRIRKAGIPASRTVFSGVGKSEEELTEAIKSGIFQINVESEQELEMISRIAVRLRKKAQVAFRVNPNVDAKTHAKITTGKKENKFGIDIAKAPALYAKTKKLKGVEAVGVAMHIGSQLTELAPFKNAYTRMAQLVRTLRKQGHNITRIDLGGGIGITYKNEAPINLYLYALMVRDIIAPLGAHVIIEPGRSIVGNAGILISRVMAVKQGTGKKFLILDAAMNDLLRPSLYDAYHEILPYKQAQKKTVYDVVGPVCESGDTFLINEKLPVLKTGDLVAIMTSGAYSAAMSSNYNTRPLIAEVMVDGAKTALVRRRQSFEQIVQNEAIPAWIGK